MSRLSGYSANSLKRNISQTIGRRELILTCTLILPFKGKSIVGMHLNHDMS